MKNLLKEKKQYGFHPNGGTVEVVFFVQQIFENAKEGKDNGHFNFIYFKSVMKTISRKAPWKKLLSIGISTKNFIKILNVLSQSIVVHCISRSNTRVSTLTNFPRVVRVFLMKLKVYQTIVTWWSRLSPEYQICLQLNNTRLHVFISCTRFRVNLHFIWTWMSRNPLLEIAMISEV